VTGGWSASPDDSEVTALAVVLATGVSYTRLPARGVDDFAGRGVYYGAASHEAVNCKGEDVYVVGGANSAGQAALFFSRYARRVVMLVRGSDLRASMSEYLVARIEADPAIEVRTCTEVVGAAGDEHLERLVLRDSVTGTTETVDASWLFVFIGAQPRTDWLADTVERDVPWFRRHRAGPARRGRPAPARVATGARPVPARGQPARRLRPGDVRAASVKPSRRPFGEGALAVTPRARHLRPCRV
jgi:thioredoxin reductase (NADPH)